MKTTLVVLLIEKGKAVYGHIGDSRLYYLHRRQIKRLTLDHSVPQMLVAAGEIGEDEIRGHPDRSKLLRVLGTEGEKPRYTPCAKPLRLWRGDGLLLCSDGFWELLDEREMLDAFLGAKTPEHWLEKMRCIVELNGAERDMDNYSAIAVTVS